MGAGQSVPKEVRKAIKHGATEFKWEHRPYISKYVPSAFWELPLSRLSFNMCGLTEVPPQMCVVGTLTELSLAENSLQQLPPQITSLKRLKRLDVSSNHLLAFPNDLVEQLDSLLWLSVAYNDMTATPSLPALKALLRFDYIGLFGNSWTDTRLRGITKDTAQSAVREALQAIISELEPASPSVASEPAEAADVAEAADDADVLHKRRSQFARGQSADGMAKAFAEFKRSRESLQPDGPAAPAAPPPPPAVASPTSPASPASQASSGASAARMQRTGEHGASATGSSSDLRFAGSGTFKGNLVPVLAAFGKEGQSVKLRPVARRGEAGALQSLAHSGAPAASVSPTSAVSEAGQTPEPEAVVPSGAGAVEAAVAVAEAVQPQTESEPAVEQTQEPQALENVAPEADKVDEKVAE